MTQTTERAFESYVEEFRDKLEGCVKVEAIRAGGRGTAASAPGAFDR